MIEDLLIEELLIKDLLIKDLLIQDLLLEDLSLKDLSLEDLSLVLVDLALEDPSKEYHFDDCEEKAHLLIDYFANVIFESLPFARGYWMKLDLRSYIIDLF